MPDQRFWIGVASLDHVAAGVAGGFCMFAHGKHEAVKRVRPGDWIAYYSPRKGMRGGGKVAAFTAVGRIREGEPYSAVMAPGRTGFRRDVGYRDARAAPIAPLLDALAFVTDRAHWGVHFRRPLFAVGRDDFERIARAMGVDLDGAGCL
jgi:hypothetical protein